MKIVPAAAAMLIALSSASFSQSEPATTNVVALSLDAGGGLASLNGGSNLVIQIVYPYNDKDNRDVLPMPFKSFGGGSTLRFGAGFDVPVTTDVGVSLRVHYRGITTDNSETFTANLSDPNRTSPPPKFINSNTGTADFRSAIEQEWTFAGGNILVKYFLTFVDNQFYVFGGLEVESILSHRIMLSQTSLNTNVKYVTNPSKFGTTPGNSVSAENELSADVYQSQWAGPKLGIGASIQLSNKFLLSGELSGTIPMTELYNDEYKPLDWSTNSVPYTRTTKFSAYNASLPKLAKYEFTVRVGYILP